MKNTALATAAVIFLTGLSAMATVITFESIVLPPAGYENNGNGGFDIDQVTFINNFDEDLNTWSGFAISNRTDTITPGLANEFSAITGGGFGSPSSSNYAVGLYVTGESLLTTHVIFESATNLVGLGAYFTNTTWAALDMQNGGTGKKFGGPTGNDPDWLKLIIQGFVEEPSGKIATGTKEFFLADFRAEDNSLDYIVTNWQFVDFSSLGSPERLEMSLTSNLSPGMAPPSYFAMDQFMVVPEPSALWLSLAGLGLLLRRKR